MKLSDWAKKVGLKYNTAYDLWKTGKLPIRAMQLKTGTILVIENEEVKENIIKKNY